MGQVYAVSHPLHPSPCGSLRLGRRLLRDGPKGHRGGGKVDLGGKAGYAGVWGVVWASNGGPRCSSASVPAEEGGIPGVCGGGGGGGAL